MKPIPLKELVRFLGPTPENNPTSSTEKSSENTNPPTSHILDLTDQLAGTAVIITGVTPPKKALTPREREEAPRKAMVEIAREKPPNSKRLPRLKQT
ncbi:MAG: hypothetical protein LAO19_00665 [Acidobacteriia bacterium]|nr:hypothetical protein [Terriglobia bacterium]